MCEYLSLPVFDRHLGWGLVPLQEIPPQVERLHLEAVRGHAVHVKDEGVDYVSVVTGQDVPLTGALVSHQLLGRLRHLLDRHESLGVGAVDVALVLAVDEGDLSPAGLRHHLLDAGDVLELRHEAPVLEEKVPDAAHVRAPHQEVRGERHAADHVALPGLGEDLALPLLGHHALALQNVELDLALVLHGAVVGVELHVGDRAQVLPVPQQVHVGLPEQVEPGPVVHAEGEVEGSEGEEGGLDVGGDRDAGGGLEGRGDGDLQEAGQVGHAGLTSRA